MAILGGRSGNVWDMVNQVFQGQVAPVPPAIWQPIAAAESGGNIYALGDKGTSLGLFQLHEGGQLPRSWYPPSKQAFNPIANAKVAAPPISKAYKAGVKRGYTGSALAIYTAEHSGHPGTLPLNKYEAPNRNGDVYQQEAYRIQQFYNSLQGKVLTIYAGTSAATTAATTGPNQQAWQQAVAASPAGGDGVYQALKSLQGMEDLTLNLNPVHDVTAPFQLAMVRGGLTIVGILLIFVGLMAFLGIGVSDVVGMAAKA